MSGFSKVKSESKNENLFSLLGGLFSQYKAYDIALLISVAQSSAIIDQSLNSTAEWIMLCG